MADNFMTRWLQKALFLRERRKTHTDLLALGGATGPYRPRTWTTTDGDRKTSTYCNRAAVFLNRSNRINSPMLSHERRLGATVTNVAKDSFLANKIALNLNKPEGDGYEVPRDIAQEISNNFMNVLSARRGKLNTVGERDHGHVAWVTPGEDPHHRDAPFITNIGSDVRIKSWQNSHRDLRFYTLPKRDPFQYRVMSNLLGHLEHGHTASSEATWLQDRIQSAYQEMQPTFTGPPNPMTSFINKTIFEPAYRQQITSSSFYSPNIQNHLCNRMNLNLNGIQSAAAMLR